MKYSLTNDPNIIKQIETVESEIHLDKLERQISDLEAQIKSMPKEKTEPDQETLELWNMQHIGFDGATVKIWDLNNNLVVDTTTASGVIATQTLDYGYYIQSDGSTPTMQTPHTIEIKKAGYQTYKKKFTLDEKIDWRIRLRKVTEVNLSKRARISY